MGAVVNPIGVALAAGTGAAFRELSGNLAGIGGQADVEKAQLNEPIRNWMQSHPNLSYLAITVLAFVPNPIFDLAGIAAGTLRMPVTRFLFFCWIGKTLKMLLFAYAGASSLDFLF
jgi:membrane protein YqaA with SNARE-associated domain